MIELAKTMKQQQDMGLWAEVMVQPIPKTDNTLHVNPKLKAKVHVLVLVQVLVQVLQVVVVLLVQLASHDRNSMTKSSKGVSSCRSGHQGR